MTRTEAATWRSRRRRGRSSIPEWPRFRSALRARLEAGARQYGDASFTRPPAEIAGEIEEELLDVCGWAFILWTRIRALRARVVQAEEAEAALGAEYDSCGG